MWYEAFYNLRDFLLLPFFVLFIMLLSYWRASGKKDPGDIYRYFAPGLLAKILGGIAFTMIYTFHYPGGDCHAYFWSTKAMVNLFFREPEPVLSILAGNTTPENYSFFDNETGYPVKTMFRRGGETFAISRFMFPFALLGFNRMLFATVLLDIYAFWGIWNFFKLVASLYPTRKKHLAWVLLFVPSVLFWGSGIMKDTFSLAATVWAVKNIFSVFVSRRRIPGNLAMLVVNIVTILSMKPYILISLVPCLGLAVSHQWISHIRNRLWRLLSAPVMITAGLFLGIAFLSYLGPEMGVYSSVEGVVSKAQITQQDLIRSEQYGTHSFDIGTYDATLAGMLSKAPQAIVAGIFRPFLWEAGNLVMLISGLENMVILLMTLYILFRTGLRKLFTTSLAEPYILFALTFSLIFAFSVGFTTANFGALVRYKIPGVPFFLTSLVILYGNIKGPAAVTARSTSPGPPA